MSWIIDPEIPGFLHFGVLNSLKSGCKGVIEHV